MLVDALIAAALLPAHQPAQPAPQSFGGPSGQVSLDAGWRYRSDLAGTGTSRGWPRGRFGGATVSLPHSGNPQSTPTGASLDQAQRAFKGTVGWYSRTVTAPATGRYALRFASAQADATVYVDGRAVGSHSGAFLPFEVDPRLAKGTHRVVVRVDWRSPARLTREAQSRTWFNYGGLNGEATMRRLGSSDVQSAAVQTALQPDGSAQVTITARVRNLGGTRQLAPVAQLGRDGTAQTAAFPPRSVPAGATATFSTTLAVPQPALWAPGSPQLYDLAVASGDGAGYQARVGLRQVTHEGGTLQLNGHPLVLRGASLQEDAQGRGDALRPADMDEVVRELQAIGANAVRVQHALAPPLMERLDAAGIFVWQQVGPVDSPAKFTLTTPALRAKANAQVATAVREAQVHPSVIGYSLGTEVSGNGRPGQGAWVQGRARYIHQQDPGRLVSVDVWKQLLPTSPGQMYADLDAVGTTSYFGWYERTSATPTQALGYLRQRLDLFRSRLPGKVVIAAELGAEGAADNPTDKPGGVGYQAALLGTQARGLADDPQIGGAFVWILRDFATNPAFSGGTIVTKVPGIKVARGWNRKGLFTYGGEAKPAATAVRSAFDAFPRP